ncbi:MAG: hypothetical protein GXP18_06020 [Gammaproteobacteria bacterium]|nr:hypothetical protein [Gammaproteobacteria bacterium]
MKNIVTIILLMMATLLSACGDSDGENGAVSLESSNLLLTASHGGKGAAWRLPDCSTCHAMEVIHKRAERIRNIVREKGYTTCTGCHGRNGSNESEPRQCSVCHNNNDLPHAPWLQGQHAHTFTVGETALLNDDQCVDCHVASDMDGVFELNRDLTGYADKTQRVSSYSSISEFCLRCHNRDHQQVGFEIIDRNFYDPLIAVEDAFHFIDQHGSVDGTGLRTYAGLRPGYKYRTVVACTDCHAMHGTDNTRLIIDSSQKGVTQLNASIREAAHSVTVNNGDYSQLCVLCHQMQVIVDDGDLETGNGLAGVHEVGSDCRTCHTHGEAIQAGL